MGDRRGLGEAVAFDQTRAGELDESPVRFDKERRGARHAGFDRLKVVLLRER